MTEPAPVYTRREYIKGYYYGFFPIKPTFLPKDYPDLSGKTAIVTGSNSGIGFHTMRFLYEKNCNVISVVRSESKGEVAKDKIVKEFPDSKGSITTVSGCDFLDLANVKPVGLKIKEILKGKPLNIIIHNAGIMPLINTETSKQGIEAIFQVNVMGPQLLQSFLDPLFLKKDDPLKRIVWVASGAHLSGFPEYGIHWEDPGFEKTPVAERPPAFTLYGQTKAANVLQAHAWATVNKKLVEDVGCVSVSVYPGNLKTNLESVQKNNWIMRTIINKFCYDGEHGAYTELYAALSPKLTVKDQGAYVVPYGDVREPRSDVAMAMKNGSDVKLWNIVEEKNAPYK
ncbi:hypothetical protein TBLA_0B00440 [Henningerozyma blattae CBS 6284]|uniref:Ketoreductase (KR) domain-containing protein n=1 Tax=Henningerozyma blattae (strain ATCC 34711 / CBS 6284 / DSM 70876 / NBRC 10599 / NRRL Y-10934 / UCD 77-7) TaxID=1071380 RepID=I2GXN6_HENB6|nr:hypothetical protein TBLA_0B00440 [Tetrapisispora blattae CBS 6284]CCH58888.1 hypothetical protein TBLA_0B00440 [Tetrapisispora blattae CBS 6284]